MRPTSHLAILISIVAVSVRLILIHQPFVDHWSWRQSDVAAIARNYFQGGFDFARPQIDWAGDQPGYVGTEFPILPFIAALLYKLFGSHEWIGRIQAVILFALSLPFFFLLVRNVAGEVAALWALFFYSFAPLNLMTSRCFMPDVPSLAFSIMGLYCFERWLLAARPRSIFLASAICISLAILIKATSALIAAPLACLAFQRFSKPPLRLGAVVERFSLWLFAAIALLPSIIWYWHAYQISLQFYPHHFFGSGGIKIMPLAWYWKIAQQIPTSTLTPVIFLLGAIGALTTRSRPRAGMFHWWLMVMLLFIVIVGYGNRHPWYQLPLVPIFAAFAGSACALLASKISNSSIKLALSTLCIAVVLLPALGYARRFYEPAARPMRDAGLALQQIAEPNALLVAADNGDPTIFYYAERRGWHFMEKDGIYNGEPRDSAQAIGNLEELRKRGASFLVFGSDTSWWLDYYQGLGQYVATNAQLVQATPEFKIYKFNPTSE